MPDNDIVKRQSFGMRQFILLLVVGIGFICAGLIGLKEVKVDPSWTKSSAQVVDLFSGSSVRAGTYYTPVFQYMVNGKTYQVNSRFDSSHRPNIGDRGEVVYNPNKPYQAKVVAGGGVWFLILLFLVIGICLLTMAPILFVRFLKRKRLLQTGQNVQSS